MTKHELRAFRAKSREMKQLREQLADLLSLSAPTSEFKAVRGANDNGSAVERSVEKIIALTNRYEALLAAYALERERIEEAFEKLTPDERTVLRAYYFDNLSWEAVAEHIDISYRHVHRLHSHALQMLKEQ